MITTNQETTDNNKEEQQNEKMKHTETAEKRRKRIRKNKEITIATINVRGLKGKNKKPTIPTTNREDSNRPNHRNNVEERGKDINKRV